MDDWPLNSLDLNLIENVWRILKPPVKLHHSMTHQQLRRAIEKEWKLITLDEINACVMGTPRSPGKGKGGRKVRIVTCAIGLSRF